jgi:hypothetical protein
MAFTYTNDPTNNNSDAVRFEIGDTVEKTHQIEDEQITYALDKEDDIILRAAARLCDALAAKFAGQETIRTGSITTDKSSITQRYIKLANRLRQRIGPTAFITNILDIAAHNAHAVDTSIVQPSFRRGMDKNPRAGDASTGSKTSDL